MGNAPEVLKLMPVKMEFETLAVHKLTPVKMHPFYRPLTLIVLKKTPVESILLPPVETFYVLVILI